MRYKHVRARRSLIELAGVVMAVAYGDRPGFVSRWTSNW